MAPRIELIGVGEQITSDDRADDGVGDDRSGGVGSTTTVTRRGLGGPRRSIGVVAGLVLVAAVMIGRSPTPTPTPTRDPAAVWPTPAPERVTPPAPAPERPPWTAPPVEPIVAAAEGITLVIGRGIEKTFIQLDTGTKTVVDVEGVPIAGGRGFLALSADLGDDEGVASGICWFSIGQRSCATGPPSDVGADGVHEFDPLEVRSLVATSSDQRWSAGWRAGQLVVADLTTGDETVVPDVRRSYFDDALVFAG